MKYNYAKIFQLSVLLGTFSMPLLTACGGSSGGNSLNPPTTSRSWGTAALLENNNIADADEPQIAIDASGNALAVWSQSDGTCSSIWSNRYTAATGTWGSAELIETGDAGDALGPQIAFDTNGNALAVWMHSDGVRYNTVSNRYTAGTGWGTAALIEINDAGHAWYPQIAIDANGNALAVWYQTDGTYRNIWANRYTFGSGWVASAAEIIETENLGDAAVPQIAFDVNGNALAVWFQSDGTRANIWANHYTAVSGWGTAVLIETDNTGSAMYPQIVIDTNGYAMAVWYQSDGTRNNIWANRYTPGTGTWGTEELIETGNAGDAYQPQITIDANGNALAVWSQGDGTRTNIWANHYTADSGWGSAVLIETDNGGAANYPQIAFDTSGNAVAVWHQSDGTRDNIWANRYTANTGWGTAVLIETDNTGAAYNPRIAIDLNGDALAVWLQNDGTRDNIWGNRFQ
jgi:hypothetical protein